MFFGFFFLSNNVQIKSRGDPNMSRIRISLDQENSYSLKKRITLLFFFTYYIKNNLLNFSIPVSHISK